MAPTAEELDTKTKAELAKEYGVSEDQKKPEMIAEILEKTKAVGVSDPGVGTKPGEQIGGTPAEGVAVPSVPGGAVPEATPDNLPEVPANDGAKAEEPETSGDAGNPQQAATVTDQPSTPDEGADTTVSAGGDEAEDTQPGSATASDPSVDPEAGQGDTGGSGTPETFPGDAGNAQQAATVQEQPQPGDGTQTTPTQPTQLAPGQPDPDVNQPDAAVEQMRLNPKQMRSRGLEAPYVEPTE